jgi:formylglycine-generating enzyme required for sulfatase activity
MKSISLLNRLSVLATMASLMVQAANVPPEIRNLKVQQRPGTYLVDVTFDLVDPDSLNGVFLNLAASSDNGVTFNLPVTTVNGDLGLVKPGTNKKLVWNAFTDWPDKYTPNAKVRIVAVDSLPLGPGRGPDGFVWIPPGRFLMGRSTGEPCPAWTDCSQFEPQHEVILSTGFWMSDHEVTRAEFEAVMGQKPVISGEFAKGEDSELPVTTFSRRLAIKYCELLTEKERASGRIGGSYVYRMPTEAEWEYAARAGTVEYRYGNIGEIAWTRSNTIGVVQPVRRLKPNAWGLFDTLGNVIELVSDWYGKYPATSVGDPTGPSFSSQVIGRGGDANFTEQYVGVTYRTALNAPNEMWDQGGLRPVLCIVR